MAGLWIAMRLDLAEDPAVIAVAAATELDEFGVVGRLHRLWSWANSQSRDGHAPGVTEKWIDRFIGVTGFARALVDVGWLEVVEGGVAIPKFEVWNSQSAKLRLLAAKRQEKRRSENVTKMSRSKRDKSVTREEKRRVLEEVDANASTSCTEAVLTYPTAGKIKTWCLTSDKLAEYVGSFPGIDVLAELNKALQWVRDNPTKKKTAQGMPKFLGGWLGRAQDRPRTGGQNGSSNRTVGRLGRVEPPPGKYDHLMPGTNGAPAAN